MRADQRRRRRFVLLTSALAVGLLGTAPLLVSAAILMLLPPYPAFQLPQGDEHPCWPDGCAWHREVDEDCQQGKLTRTYQYWLRLLDKPPHDRGSDVRQTTIIAYLPDQVERTQCNNSNYCEYTLTTQFEQCNLKFFPKPCTSATFELSSGTTLVVPEDCHG